MKIKGQGEGPGREARAVRRKDVFAQGLGPEQGRTNTGE